MRRISGLMLCLISLSTIKLSAQNTFPTTGKVGIGTTTPSENLDIIGNLKLSGKLKYGSGDTRTETRDDAGLRGDVGAQSGFFQTVSPVNYPKGATSWWHLIDVRHTNNANNYALQIAGSFYDQRLFFRKTNDKPAQPWVEIVAIDTAGRVKFDNDLAASKKPVIIGGDKFGGAIKFSSNSTTANNRNLELGSLNASGTFSSSIVVSSENGNVSIGTPIIQPAYKLAVAGDIIAERVVLKLKTTWPDYVFKPSYNLRPLSDVKAFINTYSHLPDIPSEQEVKENGIGLGELNTKLLQKVEELTLYLLQMQTNIEDQKKEINDLKLLISKLESKKN